MRLALLFTASLFPLVAPVALDPSLASFPQEWLTSNEQSNVTGKTRRAPTTVMERAGAIDLEYLVGFHSYATHATHLRTITRTLGGGARRKVPGWSHVVRNNPATKYPTDFLLLRFSNERASRRLRRTLSRDPRVKYVMPHFRYVTRKVLSTEGDGDSCACGGCFQPPKRFPFDWPPSGPEAGQEDEYLDAATGVNLSATSRRLLYSSYSVTSELNAPFLWQKGHSGNGVKVAVFDTGLKEGHPHFRKVKERTNWTNEKTLNDELGHGTFVAGVIASQSQCLGFAPDAELHIFRVFTKRQVSYTSWFMDAFNYAIYSGVNVLNLSIGGPDFMDRPFVEKVMEMSANNIIVVSAIGNDGPLYGTLNNPADQMDVIGVGGITPADTIASYSSRGMTTWELPEGYGRVKPDIVTYSKGIRGSKLHGGCRGLSGTSVASPVVAGAVALLASVVPDDVRWTVINPASMKQALVHSADRLRDANIFEQGMGKLNLERAYNFLASYKPHASTLPATLDLTDCPYMWPFCTQGVYHDAEPVIFNLTVLNGMSVSGRISSAEYVPTSESSALPLVVTITHSLVLWPWSGWLAVHMSLGEPVDQPIVAQGTVRFQVQGDEGQSSLVEVPLKAQLIPTPARARRLLWDQAHNLRYPPAYFPRDNLDVKQDVLDWNGDHPHTNYRDLWDHLRGQGYFIEVLGKDFTCFDARKYGALLLVDPEEEYFQEEVDKLEQDVRKHGLSIIVLAEWYNVDTMKNIKFFDDNTNRWWTPLTGGCNAPALNELLAPFGVSISEKVYKGEVRLGSFRTQYASGTSLARFPTGGMVMRASLRDVSSGGRAISQAPILGLLPLEEKGSGRVIVYGDSSCLDMNHRRMPACFWLIDALIRYATENYLDSSLFPRSSLLSAPLVEGSLPVRMDSRLEKHSRVFRPGATPQCSARNKASIAAPGVAAGRPLDKIREQLSGATKHSPRTEVVHRPAVDSAPNSEASTSAPTISWSWAFILVVATVALAAAVVWRNYRKRRFKHGALLISPSNVALQT